MPDNVYTDSGRRQFLKTVLSSAVVGVAVQAGTELAAPEKLSAQTNLSPDAALQELLAGNQRFAANQLTSIEHDLERTQCRHNSGENKVRSERKIEKSFHKSVRLALVLVLLFGNRAQCACFPKLEVSTRPVLHCSPIKVFNLARA
jgi:hypothetical protein